MKKNISDGSNLILEIQSDLKNGISVKTIKSNLAKKGYSAKEIKSTLIKAINKNNYLDLIKKYGIPALLVILFLFFIIMMLINVGDSTDIRLDLRIRDDILFSGDLFIVDLTINNYGKPENVEIQAQILGTGIGKKINSYVDGTITETFNLEITKTITPGPYDLQVKLITQEGYESVSRISIYINDPADASSDPVKNKTDDLDTSFNEDRDSISTQDAEIYLEAIDTENILLCNEVSDMDIKDDCIKEISIISNMSFCEFILNETKKADCLLNVSE